MTTTPPPQHEARVLVEPDAAGTPWHVGRCSCGVRSGYYSNKARPDLAEGYARRDVDEHLARVQIEGAHR